MIHKVVHKHDLDKHSEMKQNLEFWLSRPPEERLAVVDALSESIMEIHPDFKELLELFYLRNPQVNDTSMWSQQTMRITLEKGISR